MDNTIDYRGKKVKIKVDEILANVDVDKMNEEYIKFITDNKNTIFTATPDYYFFHSKTNEHFIYTFEETDKFSFFYTMLEVLE